jgi:hypothetical protein
VQRDRDRLFGVLYFTTAASAGFEFAMLESCMTRWTVFFCPEL